MPVALRPSVALEPIQWPTGEDVPVKRPNLYCAEVWDVVMDTMKLGEPAKVRETLVKFVGMVCPSKSAEQIKEDCDDEYLLLVAGYANGRLDQARKFLEELSGKAAGATASPQAEPTGTSPAELPAVAGAPCGS